MRYATTLLSKWSRREWLSVAVIAVTTAFLLGSTLLLLTAATYTGTLSSDLESGASVTHVDSYDRAVAESPDSHLVVALTTVTLPNGETRSVVGMPDDAPRTIESASVSWREASLPVPPEDGVSGPVSTIQTQELTGETTRAVTVYPHRVADTIFPADWYVTDISTARNLGSPSALVFDLGQEETHTTQPGAIPLIAALPFLVGGVTQVVRTLSVAVLGGGLLVLVVVYNVMRMSIRDRHKLITVARATGASPGALFAILLARVFILSVTGIALGYAIGVIATNAVINAATFVGLPVSIQTVVTRDIALSLLGISGFLLAMGVIAGAIASVPAVRGDPRFGRDEGRSTTLPAAFGGLRQVFRPTLVDWRAFVPTAATLSVFMLIILLTGAIGGAIAPLATTSSGTIVESGAAHPLNSRISEDYASVLRAQGIEASPEVVYAQSRGPTPYLIRGANYSAFSSVTDATLVEGRPPASADEAVIGTSLAQTLDVEVGQSLTLGGSVTPGVRRVTVVGAFSGSGVTDDQLVVPLETTKPLATGDGTVHLIRTENAEDRFKSFENQSSGLLVTALSGNSSVGVETPYTVTATVQNLGAETATDTVTVRVGNRTLERELTLKRGASTRISFETQFETAGQYTIEADGVTRSVTVHRPNTLRFPPEYPTQAPPGSTIIVPATTTNESAVAGATVTLDDRRAKTNDQGAVPMRIPSEPGSYTLTLSKEGYESVTHTLVVKEGTPKRLSGRLSVSPSSGTRLTKPVVKIQVANPWGTFLVRNLTLVTPGETETREVELAGGNISQITLSASEVGFDEKLAPGSYDLRLVSDGTVIATTTYRVTGDERVAATLANQGEYSEGTGISRAIENVFGNVQLLFVVMVSLAGLSTIGGTTATFAQAVHSNRRVIGVYRATGASRRRILWMLTTDAVQLAIPAAIVSFAAALTLLWALEQVQVLVIFGIRLAVPLSPTLVALAALGAVCLAVCSAVLAGYAFVRYDVGRNLRGH